MVLIALEKFQMLTIGNLLPKVSFRILQDFAQKSVRFIIKTVKYGRQRSRCRIQWFICAQW